MDEEKFHIGVKALIINDKNEILVLRINPEDFNQPVEDHWDLPGGRINKGDSIEETLRKEIKEEFDIDNIETIEHVDTQISNIRIPIKDEEVGLSLIIFRCRVSPNSEIRLNEEHLEYKWVTVDEAKKLLRFKFADSLIEKLNMLQ